MLKTYYQANLVAKTQKVHRFFVEKTVENVKTRSHDLSKNLIIPKLI